ncbi:MAG: hypothetical protein ACLQBB_02245 [Solirubrobacteraceae bacterium]
MGRDATEVDGRFRPTSRASGPTLIAAIVFGPLLWNALARPGSHQPLGRIQVMRSTTGGELHAMVLSGE